METGNNSVATSVSAPMSSSPAPSRAGRLRRLAGAGALLSSGVAFGVMAASDLDWINWPLLSFAGLVGVASLGLARRSVTSQILGRGVAWLLFPPSLLVVLFDLGRGHAPDLFATTVALTAGASLVLAHPMLHDAHARAVFDAVRMRRYLLASSTAQAAVGTMSALLAATALLDHAVGAAFGLGLFALAALGSVVGVSKMRGWGILLGGLTALGALISAAIVGDAGALAFALASIPGAALTLPVLTARRKAVPSERQVRVAVQAERVRVSAHDAGAGSRLVAEADADADLTPTGRSTFMRT